MALRTILFKIVVSIIFALAILVPFNASASGEWLSGDSLAIDTLNLGEVQITASTVKREGMKESYMVTKAMREGTHEASELLARLNGIHYNYASKEVKYLGSNNIVILVDSVPKDASYIKRLSPKRFDRIDVISNPTGKYAGYDAVINFHTRPTYQGYEFSAYTQQAITPGDNNGKGKHYRKSNNGVDFTFTKEKLTFSVAPSFTYGNNNTSSEYIKDFPLNGWKEYTRAREKSDPSNRLRQSQFANNFWTDYRINDNHSLSFSWYIGVNSSRTRERQNIVMENTMTGLTTDVDYSSDNRTRSYLENNFGLYYRGTVKGWNVNVSASYTTVAFNTLSSVIRSDGYSLNDPRHTNMGYLWTGADVERGLCDRWVIGASDYVACIDRKQTRLHTDTKLSDNSVIDNNFYVYAGFYPSDRLSAMVYAGSRVYHNSTGAVSKTDVMPRVTAHLTYRPSSKFMTRLSYYYFPSLPSIDNIADYGYYTDSLIYQSGNPELSGPRVNQVDLLLNFFNSLNIQAKYRRGANDIYNIAGAGYRDDAAFVHNKYENGTSDTWKFSIDYNQKIAKCIDVSVSANVMGVRAEYNGMQNRKWLPEGSLMLSYYNPRYEFRAVAGYELTRELTVEPQTVSHGMTDGFSLYVEKYLCKGNLSLNLMYFPPLHITDGEIKRRFVSPAMNSMYRSNNQFRSNNMLWIGATIHLNGGNRVNKVNLNKYTLN